MTLVTLRPNATTTNSGALTGGATAHAVLSDDSDASYITHTVGQSTRVDLGDLTLPAGGVVKNVQPRVRAAVVTAATSGSYSGSAYSSAAPAAPGSATIFATVSSTTPTTRAGLTVTGWTDPQVDAAYINVQWIAGAGISGRLYEAYLDVRYVAIPVATVVLPTGTVSDTNTPLVTWTDTLDTDGGPQTQYEVKIYSAAQYGAGGFSADTSTVTAGSGIVASNATSWQDTVILANATYRAYVRVAQTVNGTVLWSAWAFGGFTISVALPAVPTLTVTAESTNGRIKLDLTANSGSATTDRMELQRSIDAGATWVAVRTIDSDAGLVYSTTTRTTYDYEAPNGTLTQYRARALHSYSGVYAASAWSSPGSATWTATDWWLKQPTQPALNVRLAFGALTSYATVDRVARNGVFMPLGAALPIVVSDTRSGSTGAIVITFATGALEDSLNLLLDAVSTLLLQGPTGDGHPDRYVRIGDHHSERVGGKSYIVTTQHTLPWTEVASPPGVQT